MYNMFKRLATAFVAASYMKVINRTEKCISAKCYQRTAFLLAYIELLRFFISLAGSQANSDCTLFFFSIMVFEISSTLYDG